MLEMIEISELGTHTSTIKRGHYGLLDAHAKVGIFREMINRALETDIFKEKLDEVIEERQALGATRREEALEEARKKRELKEKSKPISELNGEMDSKDIPTVTANGYHIKQNEDRGKKRNGEVILSELDDAMGKRSDLYYIRNF